jgi:hypothetical protein
MHGSGAVSLYAHMRYQFEDRELVPEEEVSVHNMPSP